MTVTFKPNEPLISIHIPKTGGTTIRETLRIWFGADFRTHYVREDVNDPPERYEATGGICIHGHFNRFRGYGVDDYYPRLNQFITFLRDPFEQHASTFFYLRRESDKYKFNGKTPSSIISMNNFDEFLIYLKINKDSIQKTFANTMFAHLPSRFNPFSAHELHSSIFLHLGITEILEPSMKLLARKLDKKYIAIEPQNISERSLNISERHKKIHREIFREEHEFYEEVKQLHFDELAKERFI